MMDDDDLQRVYQWVDEIPLSRPKRNIARDFSDGVLTAEMVAHYFPRLIEIHNYPPANSYSTKMYNWNTLNTKVFKKMGFALQKEELDSLSNCTPQAVERMLKKLQQNMAKYGARKQAGEADDDAAPTGAAKAYKPPPKPPARAVTVPKAPAMSGGVARKVVATNGGAGSCEGGGGVPGAPVSISEPSMAHLEGGDAGGYEGLLDEKDAQLTEMRETVEILEVKIQKLEQLVRLKDSKIATLQAKLAQAGI